MYYHWENAHTQTYTQSIDIKEEDTVKYLNNIQFFFCDNWKLTIKNKLLKMYNNIMDAEIN